MNDSSSTFETDVLVIGGGITGAGIARDLALNGVRCILAEQHDLNAGASGANHGLLHSGARYVSSDPGSAAECLAEGRLLRRMAPHCIEDTGGLFVAVAGDDERFVADFPGLCAQCGIPAEAVDAVEARELEPALSDRTIAAYRVPDASVDPFKLTLENVAQARDLGATLLRHCRVEGFRIENGRIRCVGLRDQLSGRPVTVHAGQAVNAGGAWAAEIAALAGLHIDLVYSKGSLLVTHNRLNRRVINRLRPSSNADILVPGGTVSILGTTSVRIATLDEIFPTVKEIDFIVTEATAMIPALADTRFIRAYAGVRPLFGSAGAGDDRSIHRSFALIDHASEGVENFASITGGKLTTYRLMAEKAVDLVCRRLGVERRCRTRTEPLPVSTDAQWTAPGRAPKAWLRAHSPDDILLCECEMVPRSVVDRLVASVREHKGRADLRALGLRSRIGKGSCQGTFCSLRLAAYLYDSGEIDGDEGLASLRAFLGERWRGVRPLLWGGALMQSELQEAIHCGFCGLELDDPLPGPDAGADRAGHPEGTAG